jgi:hypothetical protein
MKVHLFIQVCILSSKTERYHLEFDSNWAISSNEKWEYITKYSQKKIYIAFEQKIAQNKNAGQNQETLTAFFIATSLGKSK